MGERNIHWTTLPAASRLQNTSPIQDTAPSSQAQKLLHAGSFQPSPCVHLAIPLYTWYYALPDDQLGKHIKCFSKFCYSKLPNLRRGSWEDLICSQLRSCGQPGALLRTTGVLRCRQSCGTEPLAYRMWHQLQVDIVRMELNCSDTTIVSDHWLGWGKKTSVVKVLWVEIA